MARQWTILFHNIPPKPLYLRAKIRQQLARIGAVAVKNAVYILPFTPDTLEDFQWIAEDIRAGGGTAVIVQGTLLSGVSEKELIAQFNAERDEAYEGLRDALPPSATPADIAGVRQRFEEIRALDFFGARRGKEIERMLQRAETRSQRTAKEMRPRPAGKVWVTRRGIKIDRMATMWLVRRFIDGKAEFRFVDPQRWVRKEGEIAFDIEEGDYSHEGNRCTFETVIRAYGLKDAALRQIAEIVHDIDLKDNKYGRADAAGIRQLIEGIVARHSKDVDRDVRGTELFDDLYESFNRGSR